jgi:hypothetical protein
VKGDRKNYGRGTTMTRLTVRLTKEQLRSLMRSKAKESYQDAIIALIEKARKDNK